MLPEVPNLCVYCGTRQATENEHVIGKVFYVQPPKYGITVPSCSRCNRGRGDGGARDLHLDEEYMRTVLCMAEGTQDHPVVDALLTGKVARSFRRRFGGLRANVAKTTGFTERRGKEGVFEPYSSPFLRPDFSRFQRVLRKITKGLYYRMTNKALPADYVVLANPAVRPHELARIMDKLHSDGALEFQPADEYEVFKFVSVLKKESRTEWLMQFYNWALFHTWTLPKDAVTPGDTGMPRMFTLEIF
jgi:hypothetical protein